MTASRTSRFLALLIDSIVCAVVSGLFHYAVTLPNTTFASPSPLDGAVLGVYKIACELSVGRTVGHWSLSIKPEYDKPAWWRVWLRNSWYIIPLAGWLVWPETWADSFDSFQLVVGLSLLFSNSKRHLGDLVSGCQMVKKW